MRYLPDDGGSGTRLRRICGAPNGRVLTAGEARPRGRPAVDDFGVVNLGEAGLLQNAEQDRAHCRALVLSPAADCPPDAARDHGGQLDVGIADVIPGGGAVDGRGHGGGGGVNAHAWKSPDVRRFGACGRYG
jgi:hypothetical protein